MQEFVNTWSIEGYVEEGKQPAELGWGTHEKHWPHDGKKHDNGWSVADTGYIYFLFLALPSHCVSDVKTHMEWPSVHSTLGRDQL